MLRQPYEFKAGGDEKTKDEVIKLVNNCDCDPIPRTSGGEDEAGGDGVDPDTTGGPLDPPLEDPEGGGGGIGGTDLDPAFEPDTDCFYDQYAFCGSTGAVGAENFPTLYLPYNADYPNPDTIFVPSLGENGACFSNGGAVACADTTPGKVLGIDAYTALDNCTDTPCNEPWNEDSTVGPIVSPENGGCVWTMACTSPVVAAPAGGSFSAALTTYAGCSWETIESESWITATAPATHLSSGTVAFTVDENTTPDPRSGTVQVVTRVASLGYGPAGSVICSMTITQEPNAAACDSLTTPATLTVSGGPITQSGTSPTCTSNTVTSANPWDGTLSNTASCLWSGAAAQSWLGRGVTGSRNVSFDGVQWVFTIGIEFVDVLYHKTSGSTPLGTYTAVDACTLPQTLTIT